MSWSLEVNLAENKTKIKTNVIIAWLIDLLTSRAFERVGSYHTRPENRANNFEKVYPKSFESFWLANARSARTTQSWKISKARKLLTSTDELFSSVFASWGFVCIQASLVLRRGFGSGSALVTSFTVNKAKSASLANKALLFVEALHLIAPCLGTSALSAFVKRFTTTELCKLFPGLPFGPEKLALTWKNFFVSVLLRSKQFRQIVPNSLCCGNTSPRRSSRLWQVFVFCFPENNFLRNAGMSTSLPHCRQMFSSTATRIKVLVCFPPPFHYQTIDPFREVRKVFLTVWQAVLHAASWEVRAKMTSLDVIVCKGNKSSFRSRFTLGARTIALCTHCRATHSKARFVSKSRNLHKFKFQRNQYVNSVKTVKSLICKSVQKSEFSCLAKKKSCEGGICNSKNKCHQEQAFVLCKRWAKGVLTIYWSYTRCLFGKQ